MTTASAMRISPVYKQLMSSGQSGSAETKSISR